MKSWLRSIFQWLSKTPYDTSPVSQFKVRISIFSNYQNPHIGSLARGMRASIVGRAKWKSEEIPLSTKIVNQYEHHNHGGITAISAITRNLKTAQMVAPNTFPFNL